jgi:uncharacterized membrane protein
MAAATSLAATSLAATIGFFSLGLVPNSLQVVYPFKKLFYQKT